MKETSHCKHWSIFLLLSIFCLFDFWTCSSTTFPFLSRGFLLLKDFVDEISSSSISSNSSLELKSSSSSSSSSNSISPLSSIIKTFKLFVLLFVTTGSFTIPKSSRDSEALLLFSWLLAMCILIDVMSVPLKPHSLQGYILKVSPYSWTLLTWFARSSSFSNIGQP